MDFDCKQKRLTQNEIFNLNARNEMFHFILLAVTFSNVIRLKAMDNVNRMRAPSMHANKVKSVENEIIRLNTFNLVF